MGVGDVSVVLATHNRAGMLRQTLDAMTRLDRTGLAVQFVIVDNNSADNTSQVIDSFADRLPLLHLFEPRQGKCCALNYAIDHAGFGGIVVFTDDDIVPHEDWLQQIADACERRREYHVFGGRIEPLWPEGVELPRWAQENPVMRAVMFAVQDLGNEEREYPSDALPFGPNFWVRRSVFDSGRRFDESLGPPPGSYKLGDETAFLMQLTADGHVPWYAPGVIVGHHVQAPLLTDRGIEARYIRIGRGVVPRRGVNRQELCTKHKWQWYGRALISIVSGYGRIWIFRRLPSRFGRSERVAMAARHLGYDLESMKTVWQGFSPERE